MPRDYRRVGISSRKTKPPEWPGIPNTECRMPKEGRNPKSEKAPVRFAWDFRRRLCFWASDFGLPSDFGFRVSDLLRLGPLVPLDSPLASRYLARDDQSNPLPRLRRPGRAQTQPRPFAQSDRRH